jgi:hypothetical protein
MSISRRFFSALGSVALAATFTACGQLGELGQMPDQLRMVDLVKAIAPEISDPLDPSTFQQSTYPVSNTHRLLLKYQKTNSGVERPGYQRRVELWLSPTQDVVGAQGALKVCPLSKNWMMVATWNYAHSFGGSDSFWSGGEFEFGDCVKATRVESGSLVFDVTEKWYRNWVRGRSKNFGMIVLGDDGYTYRVHGDISGGNAPRLIWSETPDPKPSPQPGL